MSETTMIILGSLGIFGLVTVTLVALVFDRAISVHANKERIEVRTGNEDTETRLPEPRIAERVVDHASK